MYQIHLAIVSLSLFSLCNAGLLFVAVFMLHKIYLKLDLLNRTLFPIDQG